ncbi:hypothetical protein SUDANB178_00127 [Streptomyces sp. enrichment culture]
MDGQILRVPDPGEVAPKRVVPGVARRRLPSCGRGVRPARRHPRAHGRGARRMAEHREPGPSRRDHLYVIRRKLSDQPPAARGMGDEQPVLLAQALQDVPAWGGQAVGPPGWCAARCGPARTGWFVTNSRSPSGPVVVTRRPRGGRSLNSFVSLVLTNVRPLGMLSMAATDHVFPSCTRSPGCVPHSGSRRLCVRLAIRERVSPDRRTAASPARCHCVRECHIFALAYCLRAVRTEVTARLRHIP